jgi:exodeoxyribonuclease VII large subunit
MMEQLSFFQSESWSVTDLTRYMKDLLESDHNLVDVWVRGEISNLSRPRSGHLYFTIKDQNASLRCVMWRNTALRLMALPRDGDEVEVHGGIGIYEAGGQYQLYADQIRSLGEGALYQEFLRLKAKLDAEGLFDEGRKRPIPLLPSKIGIVTSPTGAALRDILNTIGRRFPLVEVTLAPTVVQGIEAPAGIVHGIDVLNQITHPDVILVARGGGSIEDLWAFNEEIVARAIADSHAPVISGVGHQTDFTITDFVADMRAPTPTAAAELATPDRSDLKLSITEYSQQLGRLILSLATGYRFSLGDLERRLSQYSPVTRIRRDRQRIDELGYRSGNALSHILRLQRTRLAGMDQRLVSLNPRSILGRGYAVVSQPDGTVVRCVNQTHPGDHLDVRVSDGVFSAEVLKD